MFIEREQNNIDICAVLGTKKKRKSQSRSRCPSKERCRTTFLLLLLTALYSPLLDTDLACHISCFVLFDAAFCVTIPTPLQLGHACYDILDFGSVCVIRFLRPIHSFIHVMVLCVILTLLTDLMACVTCSNP